MPRIKNTILIFSLLLFFSCVKAFDPQIDNTAVSKYVISGRVTNIEGWQEVEVSLSSPVESPKYIPVQGCQGRIQDNKGNDFELTQFEPGLYKVWMGQADLTPGTSYRIQITTPDGDLLESSFDTMFQCPRLDSVYYAIEVIPTSNPAISQEVMQFYVDLNAEGDYSRYYKWDVIETWEYHAAHPFEYYYDGAMHQIDPPDYTNKVCWITGLSKNVFTLSTKSLTQNKYRQYPLQRIDGKTSRLGIMYSILVRQLALSEKAYNYWEQMRINSNEQGGLYEKQPLAIKGNLLNMSNPEKVVLGCFYASSESARRYFYHDVAGIKLTFYNFCSEESLGMFGWREFFKWEYPIYFYYNEVGALRILNKECIDCRLLGGTIVKPDFWPN
jgi:hypothetical protein